MAKVEPIQPLQGARLTAARVVWVVIVLLTVGVFFLGVLAHYEQIVNLSGPVVTESYGGSTTLRVGLAQAGFDPAVYALFQVSVGIVFFMSSLAVALFLFIRRPEEPIALLVSLSLVLFAFLLTISHEALNRPGTIQQALNLGISYLAAEVFTLTFYVFPDGRFVPQWTKWLMLLWILIGIPQILVPNNPLPEWVGVVSFLGPVLTTIGAQVYRYRRVSSASQRQQTKWVVFGFATGMIGFVAFVALAEVLPSVALPGAPSELIGTIVIYALLTLIPFSLAIAVLRSRLWDIDIIVRKTLTYAIVVVLLAIVYLGSIVLLQQLFASVTGQRNEIITVLSTLAIAALFVPLRNRIQEPIDRRFYRKKYNAQKVLQDFGETVRDETDLEELKGKLIEVVNETMQPKSVGVWLRPETGSNEIYGGLKTRGE